MNPATRRLIEVCDIIAGQHIASEMYDREGEGIPYLTGPADFGERFPIVSKWTRSPKVFAKSGDVLVTVKGAGVGKTNLGVDAAIGRQLMALRPKNDYIDQGYLFAFIRSQETRLNDMAQGATVPGIGKDTLEELAIPLPSVPEQRRIAYILDEADALRRKRAEAIRLANSLVPSVFYEMFGDVILHRSPANRVRFERCLAIPLRNGLSPSTNGTYPGRVLTLSAITGNDFDQTEMKEAFFAREFNESDLVNAADFLICRGNGNVHLVGIGKFPKHVSENVVFPDTMIAARINTSLITPEFLEALWTLPMIRQQLLGLARTTSGIHKVNQTMLENLEIPVVEMERQLRFASVFRGLTVTRTQFAISRNELDNLFHSLLQRAFRGEL